MQKVGGQLWNVMKPTKDGKRTLTIDEKGKRTLTIDEKAIQSTHAPDGKKVDVRPLQKLINEILKPSATTTVQGAPRDQAVLDSHLKSFKNSSCLQELVKTVHKISSQLWCKCLEGGDMNTTTVVLFNTLSHYSWEAKVVLALAAFAVLYGESWMMAEQQQIVPLADSIKLLRQLPDKSKLFNIRSLIDAMLTVTNTILDFDGEPLPDNISIDIQTAVSWTVGSVVVCTSHIIGFDDEYAEDDQDNLSKLTEKIAGMNSHLVQLLCGWNVIVRLTIDENAIRSTHAPDINNVDVSVLHQLINETFMPSSTTTVKTTPQDQAVLDSHLKSLKNSLEPSLEELAKTVHKIYFQLWCKCWGGGDANSTTVAVFNTLSHYSWEAKVVLILAAFAILYGESLLMAEQTNPLANFMKLLKQLPDKLKLSKIWSLIDAMVKLTNSIVEVVKVDHLSLPENISTQIQTAVSWTGGCIVVCTTQIIGFVGLDDEYTEYDLSKLTKKVDRMNTHLDQLVGTWRQCIEEKKKIEAEEKKRREEEEKKRCEEEEKTREEEKEKREAVGTKKSDEEKKKREEVEEEDKKCKAEEDEKRKAEEKEKREEEEEKREEEEEEENKKHEAEEIKKHEEEENKKREGKEKEKRVEEEEKGKCEAEEKKEREEEEEENKKREEEEKEKPETEEKKKRDEEENKKRQEKEDENKKCEAEENENREEEEKENHEAEENKKREEEENKKCEAEEDEKERHEAEEKKKREEEENKKLEEEEKEGHEAEEKKKHEEGENKKREAEEEENKKREAAEKKKRKVDEDILDALPHPENNEQVVAALRNAGLKSSNLVLGIDFTASNKAKGEKSFKNRSLHDICGTPNPYQQAIDIIGKAFAPFAKDNKIPCYGFGDATTKGESVFSFHNDDIPCQGFEEVLSCYTEIVSKVKLAGPTSYAPVIEAAIDIVEKSGGQHHVLVIIADEQVTASMDRGKTFDSIVTASLYALSIVLIGVGDGPWDEMKRFADNIPPGRKFDNFQFVQFHDIMSKYMDPTQKEAAFAFLSLKKIPMQYKASMELGLLGRTTGRAKKVVPIPPPFSRPPLG